MSTRSLSSALTLAAALACVAAPAHAWHIAGTLYCDVDHDGVIDVNGPDTRITGKTVKMTSLFASPGTIYTTSSTSPSGSYSRAMPDWPDTYKVQLSGLPLGWTVIVPSGGYKNVQLTNTNTSADNVNFLVQGCAPSTTTTTTSTTTTTTKPTTTTTKPPTTTTSTSTSTTTTTTIPACSCADVSFRICRFGKINNEAIITGTIAANDPGASLRLSHNVQVADGALVIGDRVELDDGVSVWKVQANTLANRTAIIRDGITPAPALPLADPCCPIPAFTCGGPNVNIGPNEIHGPLAPGRYGSVRVMNGSVLKLGAGTYTFCSLKLAHQAAVDADGSATVNVTGNVIISSGSEFGSAGGTLPQLNVAGRTVRASQNGILRAHVSAPNAHITLGRDALMQGTFCVDQASTDKRIDLICPCD